MRRWLGLAFLCVLSIGHAQTLIIPQIADGGAWQTTLILTNTTATAAPVSLSFYQETSGGTTQPWNLAFIEGGPNQNVTVPAAGSLFLHTLGTNSATSVGWGQIQSSSAGVVAYAIFTQRVPGRTDQDGTAPAAASASRILVPFDNSSGFATTIAVANPTGANEAISVNIELDTGTTSQASLPALPPQGHAAFALAQQFQATSGHRGLAEFYVANGSLAMLALRFNPTGALTAAPVYTQTGAPIIGGSGGGGGGMLPTFKRLLVISGTFSPQGQPDFNLQLIIESSLAGGWIGSVEGGSSSSGSGVFEYGAVWASASVSGLTFTFSGLEVGAGAIMTDSHGNVSGITSGSLTVTLAPQAGVGTVGTVSGSLSLTSPLATLSGPISGSYIAQ